MSQRLVRPLVECVPNFSEGRDRKKIDQILDAVREVEGEPSWDWLSMLGDVQLALHALEATSRSEAKRVKRPGIF